MSLDNTDGHLRLCRFPSHRQRDRALRLLEPDKPQAVYSILDCRSYRCYGTYLLSNAQRDKLRERGIKFSTMRDVNRDQWHHCISWRDGMYTGVDT